MTRRIFVDTEWTAPPWSDRSELMWIGLADQDGRSWYGISADVKIDPTTNDFISGVFNLITPEEPRLPTEELAASVLEFCGDAAEFWAWVPTVDSVAAFFDLEDDDAVGLYDQYWDWDLQLLRSLIRPWPSLWSAKLCDLNEAATRAGVVIPPRAENHLHPRVHVEWNRDLFALIDQSSRPHP